MAFDGCCSPASSPGGLTIASGCCSPAPAATDGTIHDDLAKLLDRYDVNEYAASVKVYAVRPKA